MKNILLILLLLTVIACSTNLDPKIIHQLEDYALIKMVSESNEWYMINNVESLDEPNNILETRKRRLKYFFEGDTIINGLLYQKMYSEQYDSIFHQSYSNPIDLPEFQSTFSDMQYVGALREKDQVVNCVLKNETIESFYADFNIVEGEILQYKWNINDVIVTQIDSLEIGNDYITKYKLSNDQYFYEGIGASFGLFQGWQVNANVGGFLTCFKNENAVISIEEGFYYPQINCPEF